MKNVFIDAVGFYKSAIQMQASDYSTGIEILMEYQKCFSKLVEYHNNMLPTYVYALKKSDVDYLYRVREWTFKTQYTMLRMFEKYIYCKGDFDRKSIESFLDKFHVELKDIMVFIAKHDGLTDLI